MRDRRDSYLDRLDELQPVPPELLEIRGADKGGYRAPVTGDVHGLPGLGQPDAGREPGLDLGQWQGRWHALTSNLVR